MMSAISLSGHLMISCIHPCAILVASAEPLIRMVLSALPLPPLCFSTCTGGKKVSRGGGGFLNLHS